MNSTLAFPPLMEPVRAEDRDGAVCYPPSAELYLGHARGRIGNEGGFKEDSIADYTAPKELSENHFYLNGQWASTAEYVEAAGDGPALHRIAVRSRRRKSGDGGSAWRSLRDRHSAGWQASRAVAESFGYAFSRSGRRRGELRFGAAGADVFPLEKRRVRKAPRWNCCVLLALLPSPSPLPAASTRSRETVAAVESQP